MSARMPAPRLALVVAASLASLAVAAPASAADAPKYGSLPTGHVTTPPTPKVKKPAAIGARESTPGFYVVSPAFPPNVPFSSHYANVVGNENTAKAIKNSEGFGGEETDQSTCFAESTARWNPFDTENAGVPEWETNQAWQANLYPKTTDNPQAGVGAIHSERLVTKDGLTSLESVDAWVDPVSHGARQIGKASLPLAQVGSAIGGVKVFAARDTQDGKPVVQYVVIRGGERQVESRLGGMMASQGAFGMRGTSCGHLRITLGVEPGNGESAVIIAPVQVGSDRIKDEQESEPEGTTTLTPMPEGALDRADGEVDAKAKKPPRSFGPRGIIRKVAGTVAPQEMQQVDVRTRDMQIHLSVSQSSADREPVLAISYGWSGREQTQRMFLNSAAPAVIE